MISKLNLSRNTIRVIRFVVSVALFMYFDWSSFHEDAIGLLIRSAGISLPLVFLLDFIDDMKDEDQGHVIYSSLTLENEIQGKIKFLGYTLKTSKSGSSMYAKSKRWNSIKIKLTKTEYFLKIQIPKHLVAQFEQFIR